jgi:hypothetical protein
MPRDAGALVHASRIAADQISRVTTGTVLIRAAKRRIVAASDELYACNGCAKTTGADPKTSAILEYTMSMLSEVKGKLNDAHGLLKTHVVTTANNALTSVHTAVDDLKNADDGVQTFSLTPAV